MEEIKQKVYENVTLSLHSSSKEKKIILLMLSKSDIKNVQNSEVMIHYKMINDRISSMLDLNNQITLINEEPATSIKKKQGDC